MSKSYKCLNSQILGLVGFFLLKIHETPWVWYIKSASKMMIPGVKFKIVKNLISVSTLKFQGWFGFFKNSQNTMGVVYFWKAQGKNISRMMIPGVKLKNVNNLSSVSTLKFWGWLGFSKSHGTPYMWYIFGKPSVQVHQKITIPGVKFKNV